MGDKSQKNGRLITNTIENELRYVVELKNGKKKRA